MSPVFQHGRLRLYLLKLLDEAPRHGYEVIRLLQDRFLGVYAPSPGTIYPRLARLEEEGLVTHDDANGRKVYRITDKGREELRARLDDLAELEESITASVRDIAREVTEDVRETVRSLREELASVARDFQGRAGPPAPPRDGGAPADDGTPADDGAPAAREHASDAADAAAAGPSAGQGVNGTDDTRQAGHREGAQRHREEAHREEAGRRREETHREEAGRGREEAGRSRREAGRGREDSGRDWGDWAWAGRSGWGNWGWHGEYGPHGCADPHAYRDMEKLAKQFTRELRKAAWQAQAVGEDAVRELRGILDETIDRIRSEVFRGKGAPPRPDDPEAGGR